MMLVFSHLFCLNLLNNLENEACDNDSDNNNNNKSNNNDNKSNNDDKSFDN